MMFSAQKSFEQNENTFSYFLEAAVKVTGWINTVRENFKII